MPLQVTPADASLGGVKLPFDEQIAFFRGKLGNLIPTRTWTDVRHAAHDTGFMVAGAMKADLLADFAQVVDTAIAEGKSLGWFRVAFDAIVEEHGWSHTGGRDWRSRVIYQTNLLTSYAAGRLAQLRDPGLQRLAPYWMYVHNDSVMHPRPLHLSWHKRTLPADDPWFKEHYPPNGWGCRCRVTAVSEAKARRDGGRFGRPPDDGINPKTGAPNGIDKGFAYMPGDTVTDNIRQALLAKTDKLPAPIAAALKDELTIVSDNREIAQAIDGQTTWKDLGLPDLRDMADRAEAAPALLPAAGSRESAVEALRAALGVSAGASRKVETPTGQVEIRDDSLPHVVEKRADQRERFAPLVLPTLERPTEVWSVRYDDDSTRDRYVKLFSGSKYDLLVIVKVEADGRVLWNVMQRDRKRMNAMRVGNLLYRGR